MHRFSQVSDAGLEFELLQNYIFVALDIFKSTMHNNIDNKLEAWLTFLCRDEPEWIIKLINLYPEFKALYDDAYNVCLSTERVMEMFSKELRELDRNTVRYMIDEMQKELLQKDEQLSQKDEQLSQKDELLKQKDEQLRQMKEKYKKLEQQMGLS